MTVNPNNSSFAAIWEFSNGTTQINTFNSVEWKIAETISANGSAPSIAVNPTNNHVIAVWTDLSAGDANNTIKVSEFDGTTWPTPASISATITLPGSPRIAINSEGYGIITWNRLVDSDTVIEAVTSE
ncbi:MAG: hypothetical protein COT85_05770 [Chlamydiae bacterium CG10_big_fil_rev_8_21_14_0_10_42_34]|nr:MAG: hypothetical protein COT85_05770 [Chlamydiae bacterium CG10_big_fil_rev_8_21_14_0_10_42_34]